MIAVNLNEVELNHGWGENDPTMRARVTFPIFGAHGAESSGTVYFEVRPGEHVGRHTDSAEEILYIVEGEGEAVVGDERFAVRAGSLALVPELVPHDVYATGGGPIKVLGFFAAAQVDSVFDEAMQPMGRRDLSTRALEVV